MGELEVFVRHLFYSIQAQALEIWSLLQLRLYKDTKPSKLYHFLSLLN
jgi:hypothetical protein